MVDEKQTAEMKPIWYFVGWILTIMGGIIFLTGIYYLISPASSHTVLANLHPNVWWGAIMLVAGIIFLWTNRDATV